MVEDAAATRLSSLIAFTTQIIRHYHHDSCHGYADAYHRLA